MTDATENQDDRLFEISRILRKHFAFFCSLNGLTREQRAAVNEIRASSRAARYPSIANTLNPVVVADGLTGTGYEGVTAKGLFRGASKKVHHDLGLVEKSEKWPKEWDKKSLKDLAESLAKLDKQ